MSKADDLAQHWPADNPCNGCAYAACRNGAGSYFRQCSQFREWFTGRWQGYQITMEELKAKSR